jgi:hypothetical protein
MQPFQDSQQYPTSYTRIELLIHVTPTIISLEIWACFVGRVKPSLAASQIRIRIGMMDELTKYFKNSPPFKRYRRTLLQDRSLLAGRTPQRISVVCSTGFTAVAWVLNLTFLYFPILGAPKSTIMSWVKDNDGRLIALAAGIICGLGTSPSCTHRSSLSFK